LERFREKYNIIEDAFLISLNNEGYRSNDSNWSMSSPYSTLKPWRTIICLDKQIWHKMSKCESNNDNKCTTLRPGWTDIIYNEIWRQIKIPCCYAFKSARINLNSGEIFLKIKGKCSECGALFNAYSMHEPNDKDTDIKFTFLLSIQQISFIKKSDNCERRKELV